MSCVERSMRPKRSLPRRSISTGLRDFVTRHRRDCSEEALALHCARPPFPGIDMIADHLERT